MDSHHISRRLRAASEAFKDHLGADNLLVTAAIQIDLMRSTLNAYSEQIRALQTEIENLKKETH